LEHMLFMGTKKFPGAGKQAFGYKSAMGFLSRCVFGCADENEWESWLSNHGGSSNASTDAGTDCAAHLF
jgi:hypothetical protein